MTTIFLKKYKCEHKMPCKVGLTKFDIVELQKSVLTLKLWNRHSFDYDMFNAVFDEMSGIEAYHRFINFYFCNIGRGIEELSSYPYLEAFPE